MALTDEQPAAHRPDNAPCGRGLRLDRWDPDAEAQVEAWLRARNDPDFRRWNTPLTLVTDLAGARDVLRRQAADSTCEPFRITDAESGATLGHIGINMIDRTFRTARVGYWTLPEARGRRVATRALALAADWAFAELDLHRLELGHALGHEASCRIAGTCGFAYEGTLRGAMFEAGRKDAFRDVHLHARLATDPGAAAEA
ncbi:RimJ/RimL family protein N-acetyltransferase [Streptomyces sp. Ag109_O5-1]|uniref:GNAT family N-acetyltransferase n=1 Tax=Streptomyces sp. Ag109_O5-1 TaxID=1938851 RepID=UPI000F4EB517|nr:GNAT family N-acetyltransferase [Streptomyces sp. Ag109_O5-1]RPE43009.1 RimJ/RimL family protein N-acetyltransferase [Streptomyces sp. Ag109_O5-1]